MPWDETENEIRHRERDPADFDEKSFKRITLKRDVPRVYGIIGHLKGESKTTLQSLRFPKPPPDNWTMAQAKAWRAKHFKAEQALSEEVITMEVIRVPHQFLAARFAASEADRATRTVPMTFYTGAEVLQFNFERGLHRLTLSMEQGGVKLDRLNAGGPFTKGHRGPNDPDSVIGRVLNARVEAGKCRAEVVFSKHHPDADRLLAEVFDGVLTNVSVEAAVLRMHETTKDGDKLRSFFADEWEPSAVALVAQGGDPNARINAAAEQFSDCQVQFAVAGVGASAPEVTHMMNEHADAITALGAKHNMAALAAQHVGQGSTLDQFRVELLNALAAREELTPTRSHHAMVTKDERTGLVDAMAEAVACRYTGAKPGDRARQYVGARIIDLARICCEVNGVRVGGYDAAGIIRLSMLGTTDFPELLTGTGQRILLAGYAAAQPAIKQVARASTAADFRAKSMLRVSEAPKFLKVPEGAQITIAGRSESKETYALLTYGRGFSLTRQALINDDLGAFSDLVRDFGVSAGTCESQVLVDLLYGPAGVGPAMGDTYALFSTQHSNLAGSGGAISDTTLAAARLALRLAKGLDGVTIIEAAPKFLVVPAALETLAEKYLATLYPAQVADANVFAQKLQLVVVPMLDAHSATVWYVFADPAVAPVLEFAYLEGNAGPQMIREENQSGVLGVQFYAFLDYGCGAIAYRGAYRNAGA